MVRLKEGRTAPAPEPIPESDDIGDLAANAADLGPEAQAPGSEPTVPDDGPSRRYRIEFHPRPDLLRAGIDPLGFLDELRSGPRRVCETDPPAGSTVDPSSSVTIKTAKRC